MSNKLEPLYYAIIRHFTNDRESCAADVVEALTPKYASYKLLTLHDVDDALAVAKENGILEETRCDLDDAGNLRIYYRITDFGTDMISRYLG